MHRSLIVIVALVGTSRADDLVSPPPLPQIAAIEFAAATGLASTLSEVKATRGAAVALGQTRLPLMWAPLIARVLPQLAFGTPNGAGVRVGIEQAIPLDSRRDAARATLDVEARRLEADAAGSELEATSAIARAWIDSWAAGATFDEALRARDLARQIESVTERAVTAGAATAPELADARALLASAETTVLDAEGRARDASFRLGAAIGASGPRRASAELPSVALPPIEERRASLAALATIPAVRARRLAALASRARAAEAVAQRAPELLVGGELTVDPGGDRRIAATLGFAWPVHDRGERESAEWQAASMRDDGEAERITRIARFELAQALHDVEHTEELLKNIEQVLVPAVDDAAHRRRRAYELGESTIVEVFASERTASAAHQAAITARADYAWTQVRARLLLQAGAAQ